MDSFLHQNFLLDTEPAQRLFFDYAEQLPILDYHSHLPPDQVADDTRFANLTQVWLGGDHYKWRLMRANGIPESDITGHTDNERRFRAWAQTVPKTLGNPIYHWTHLELRRYFGIEVLLDETTAPVIWKVCNEYLASPEFSVKRLLQKMNVRAICTTDDPADDLAHHCRHQGSPIMVPTFRPDKALACTLPTWPAYLQQLGLIAGIEITNLGNLIAALDNRHRAFHELGCRLSDHALVTPWAVPPDSEDLEAIFQKLLCGQTVAPQEIEAMQTKLLLEIASMDHTRNWTMQIHLGALRNLNSVQFAHLGPDTGYDAISDQPIARKLADFLDMAARDDQLPRTILYGLNPRAYDCLATVMACFQDGRLAGKLQLGSAWWFNDHIDGMDTQLRTLASQGLLSRFIGMLTDSRSFLSFPRHEYFRRVLCRLVGSWIDRGLAPADYGLVGNMIQDICFRNARDYLKIPGTESA